MNRRRQTEWSHGSPHYYYVVYFYQSGRFQRYIQHEKNLFRGLYHRPTAVYDFSSDLVRRPSFYRPVTVEQIVASGYFAVPKTDPVKAIILDKKQTSRLGLDDIISQIRHRYEVYEQNIYEINVAKCAAINSLYLHVAYHGPAYARIEYSVNKRLDKLYKDQRDERTKLWQDISRLRQLLPETAQQYLTAYRKVSILEYEKGDVH